MHLVLIILAARFGTPDPNVMAALRSLASVASHELHDGEVGAFLVRDRDGNLSCVLWPRSIRSRYVRYAGKLPDGAVAFAHSHPASVPEPSRVDVAEAQRIGLPSYVVSPRHVYLIEPSSAQPIHLAHELNWSFPTSVRCDCARPAAVQAPGN